MALYLRIAEDNQTDINLVGDTLSLGVRYNPGASPAEFATNVDTIELVLQGTGTAMIAYKDSIQARLDRGRRRQKNKAGSKVYLKGRQDDSDDIFESEIVGGMVEWSARPPEPMLRSGLAELIISVERVNHWTGPETSLPLTNRNGTNVTTGITVNNTDDSDEDNFVFINDTDVPGGLPGPVRLRIQNTVTGVGNIGHVWIGHNVESDPANFNPVIEAEDGSAAGGHSFGTTLNNNSSELYYGTCTWADDSVEDIWTASLDSTFLGYAAGNLFKSFIISASDGISQASWFKLQVRENGVMLAETPWIRRAGGDTGVWPVGNLRLPPGIYNSAIAPRALDLVLMARCESVGTHTLDFDSIVFLPMDGYRALMSKVTGFALNGYLYDDGYNGYLYATNSTPTNQLNNYSAIGKPISLVPGRDQKLYFINQTQTGVYYATVGNIKVWVYHRERRLVL